VQNYGAAKASLLHYAFDVMILGCRNVMAESLVVRRELLWRRVLNRLSEPIRSSPELNASLSDLARSVREQGFQELVAKRRNHLRVWASFGSLAHDARQSRPEVCDRWLHPSAKNFDALVSGYSFITHFSRSWAIMAPSVGNNARRT
jgi:hypothetical protein